MDIAWIIVWIILDLLAIFFVAKILASVKKAYDTFGEDETKVRLAFIIAGIVNTAAVIGISYVIYNLGWLWLMIGLVIYLALMDYAIRHFVRTSL